MKVLVLLSLVAFCTSLPTFLGRRVRIGEDGIITLGGDKGYEVDLYKNLYDPRKLTTVTRNPTGLYDTLVIDETNDINKVNLRNIFGTKYSTYNDFNQADLLTDIFRQYEGTVDEDKYSTLLNKIKYLVDANVLDSTVYDILGKWNVDDRLHEVSDIVPVEELTRKYIRQNVLDTNELTPQDFLNTVERLGLIREEVLKTALPTEQYLTNGRVGLNEINTFVPTEEYLRTGLGLDRLDVLDTVGLMGLKKQNSLNSVGRLGLTRDDVLKTNLPTEQYLTYGRVGLNKVDTSVPTDEYLRTGLKLDRADVLDTVGLMGLNKQNLLNSVGRLGVNQEDVLDTTVPTEEYLKYGLTGMQGNWAVNRDLLNKLTTVDDLQTLLQQIKVQRDLQQGLFSQGQLLNKQFWTPKFWNNELTDDEILREIYNYQLRNTEMNPLNRFLVNLKLTNGLEKYFVPEQFFNMELLENWFTKQQLINLKVDKMIDSKQTLTEELVFEQRLINQLVEKFIEQLVQHQTLITVQIEKFIVMRQVVPQELVYQQRLIYQQVQKLIEKLVFEQTFINSRIQLLLGQNAVVHQEFFVQQKVVYQQVFKLVQQLFVQQNVLKQHIDVLVQQGLDIPEELVLFQKMTYKQLESFIQILIKQFVYQQTYFYQLIQLFVQQGHVIPEELINQYTIIYNELQELIKKGDLVPEQWIYKYKMIHQQIMSLLQQGQVVPEQVVRKWVPEQQQWTLFKIAQRLF